MGAVGVTPHSGGPVEDRRPRATAFSGGTG